MKKRELKKSAINNIYQFAGQKGKLMVFNESSIEFDACYHFEYSSKVISFESQPLYLSYKYKNKLREFAPDFLVETPKRKIYFEVKQYRKTLDEEFKFEFKAKQESLKGTEYTLELITDQQIRVYPLLDNLHKLHRYNISNNRNLSKYQNRVMELVKTSPPIQIDDIINFLGEDKLAFQQIAELVSNHYLITDLSQPFSSQSKVELLSEDKSIELAKDDKSRNLFESLFDGVQTQHSQPRLPDAEATLPPPFYRKDLEEFRDLSSFQENLQNEAIRRYEYIKTILDNGTVSWTDKSLTTQIQLISQERDDYNPPSWRTVERWYKAYKKSNGSLMSLVPSVSSGNRNKKVNQELESLIHKATQRFLSGERPYVKSAYKYFETILDDYNEEHGTHFKALSYESFRKRVKKITPYEYYEKRYSKYRADKEFKAVGKRNKTERVLERVEVDHTKLDLFVLNDESTMALGRPYLTLLLDTHTSCVCGFYVGFEPPSLLSVSRALRHSILPKEYLLEQYSSIQNNWECCGIPELLVCDNGKEFWDKDFQISCYELGINLLNNKVKQPWLKGSVERFFGTVNQELLASIPGKSFSNIFDRDEYNPEKNAVITMGYLKSIIHHWIVDDYLQSPDNRMTRIPALKWQQAIEMFPPNIYNDDPEKLSFLIGRNDSRMMTKSGIEFYRLKYDSVALANYRARYGFHQTNFKYDPDDLGSIYIHDPYENKYFKVYAVDQDYAAGRSLWNHHINRRYALNFIKKNYQHQHVVEARAIIEEIIQEAIHKSATQKHLKPTTGIINRARSERYIESSNVKKAEQHLQEQTKIKPKVISKNLSGWEGGILPEGKKDDKFKK